VRPLEENQYDKRTLHEKRILVHNTQDLRDSPKLRIVDFFLDNPMFDFTKKEVIEALGMSKQTFYKYFPELEEYDIVKVSRRIGKAKLYRINPEHPLVNMLREYEKKVSLQIAEKEANKIRKPIPAEA
jgi:AraC-like DNA-binding protein